MRYSSFPNHCGIRFARYGEADWGFNLPGDRQLPEPVRDEVPSIEDLRHVVEKLRPEMSELQAKRHSGQSGSRKPPTKSAQEKVATTSSSSERSSEDDSLVGVERIWMVLYQKPIDAQPFHGRLAMGLRGTGFRNEAGPQFAQDWRGENM